MIAGLRTRGAAGRRTVAVVLCCCLYAGHTGSARALVLLDPTSLTKYIDPLPNPLAAPLAPSGLRDGVPWYDVSMAQFEQRLHGELPPTTLWGYNGSFPGPLFEVVSGRKIKVTWRNELADASGALLPHLLPVDTTVHGAGPHLPAVRVVPHLHGGVVEAASDGFPEYWFTADPDAPPNGMGGPAGDSVTYTYHNEQAAATLWYHDHGMGITRLNVYAGLAGPYIVRDESEQALNLPAGAYEVPLLLQDRTFDVDGRLFYPRGPGDLIDPGGAEPLAGLPADFASDASVVPHFFGDVNLVNGVIWPFLEVEPRKYRLRVLNGSNARFYNLLLDAADAGTLTFHQIGSDGGMLPQRVALDELLLGPAERADVIVDFANLSVGSEVVLRNLAPDGPFGAPGGAAPADPATTGQVMQFRVVPPTGPDTSEIPDRPGFVPRTPEAQAVVERELTLVSELDEYGRPKLLLDGASWSDPITEDPQSGSTEIWQVTNYTPDAHPIHLHLVQFQILSRESRRLGSIPLQPHELGWKDTVVVDRGETVRLIATFDQFEGLYVWHCHILEHEDYEMMRPYVVVPEPSAAVVAVVGALLLAVRRRS